MYLKLLETEEAANHVIESDDLSSEERHEIASEAILGFAEFCDQNAFYLDDEVKLHAVGTFIGIEDIPKQKTKKRKEELLQQHREKLSRAKEMIRAEAGLKELDRYFSSILKPDHSSELVEYYRSLKAEREKH